MTAYVYGVLHDDIGNVFIGSKFEKGYFFWENGAGAIVPAGQWLNGSGKSALPGGKRERGETIEAGARREFYEETGVRIDADAQVRERSWEYFDEKEGATNTYEAAYFRVSTARLKAIAADIAGNLAAGVQAQQQLIREQGNPTITTYAALRAAYPQAPPANELDRGSLMNLTAHWDWVEIESWKQQRLLGWFHTILAHLKNVILVELAPPK
ncbi:NUDIX hydrolase [Micromonospora sp. DT233]|uniref:NUDIX hydrolase n=1 Tax=Micromonospora sp. DT233 TaxID=3393432 RepID=UPI003CEA3889